MNTIYLGLLELSSNFDLAFWSSAASIVGLIGIIFNTWRLSRVKKMIEEDRFKIAETMKPFDLYFNIQKTSHILKQQQNNPYAANEEKEQAGTLLKSLGEVAVYLRQYFREVHRIHKIRDNAYVDAGHLFLRGCLGSAE